MRHVFHCCRLLKHITTERNSAVTQQPNKTYFLIPLSHTGSIDQRLYCQELLLMLFCGDGRTAVAWNFELPSREKQVQWCTILWKSEWFTELHFSDRSDPKQNDRVVFFPDFLNWRSLQIPNMWHSLCSHAQRMSVFFNSTPPLMSSDSSQGCLRCSVAEHFRRPMSYKIIILSCQWWSSYLLK